MALKDSVLNIVITAKDLAKGTIDRFRKGLKQTEDQGQKTGNVLNTLATRVVKLVAAYASFKTITSLVGAVLGTGDKFEKLGIQMTAVMGSIAEGERATDWIKEFTKKTPLQLEDTTKAFVRLKNFGLDPMDGTLQSVVDMNAKLGGSQEDLLSIANALGKAWGKQKLQGEEIMQLVERGVPVWELLEEVTGKNVAQLQKLSSEGKLGRDVMTGLIEAIGKNATGAAEANMQTLGGIVSNLRDQFQEFLNTVATSGTLDFFKEKLQGVADTANRMATDGTLAKWAQGISNAITSVATAIAGSISFIVKYSAELGLLAKAFLAIQTAKAIEGIVSLGLKAVASASQMVVFGKATDGARVAVTKFQAALSVLQAFAIGWSIGTYLRDKFVVVEKAGNHMVGGLLKGWALLQLGWDTFKAGFTDGTVEEAWDRYAASMREISESTRVLNEEADKAAAGLDSVTAGAAAAAAAAVKLGNEAAPALQEIETNAEQAARALKEKLAADIAAVVTEFEELDTEAKRSSEAVKKLLDNYDLGLAADLEVVIGGLVELQGQGKITAQELQQGLSEALSSLTTGELVAFRDSLEAMFQAGTLSALEYAALLEGPVSAAMKNLGLDATLLRTGISEVGTDAIASFKLLGKSMEDSGATAQESSKIMAAAYLAAFDKIKTEAGRTELLNALTEQVREGVISVHEYNQALAATGQQAEADTEKVRALREEIERLRREMQGGGEDGEQLGDGIEQGTEKASVGVALLSAALSAYTQQMENLSAGALRAWEDVALGMRPAAEETDELTARINTLTEGLGELEKQAFRVADSTGIQRSLRDMKIAANEVEIAFIEQTQAARGLVAQYEAGTLAADAYISRAQNMIQFGDLLNDQDLSTLTEGIQQAERAMASLRDQTADTLGDLQNELDRLEGRTDAIREREYQQRINELNQQLLFAKQTGDREAIRNASESLKLAEQIYRIENANRQEAERERRKRAAEQAAAGKTRERTQSAEPSAPRQTSNNVQTIRLEAGNNSVQVTTNNPDKLLDILAAAGLRTS